MSRSFQDDLARQNAANASYHEAQDRVAARGRFEDYQSGQHTADDLIRRAAGCRSYDEKADTLRRGAASQPNNLAGRVAAGELSDAVARAQQEADRLAVVLQARHQRGRGRGIDREIGE